MDGSVLLIGLGVAGVIIWAVGHSFIDTIYDRKEEILNKMINGEEGDL